MTMHQQIDTLPATMPLEARRRRRQHGGLPLLLITMCLGVFLAQLDTSVVNLALGRIGAELGSSVAQLQWVVDSYNLTYASCLLSGGTLGDIFGRRRVFMTGIVLFATGSLLCGVAPENASLIGGRMLAGLGAALQIPVSLAILSDAYADAEQRARAIGIWAGCNGLAPGWSDPPWEAPLSATPAGAGFFYSRFRLACSRLGCPSPACPNLPTKAVAALTRSANCSPCRCWAHCRLPSSKGRAGGGATSPPSFAWPSRRARLSASSWSNFAARSR